MTTHGIKLSAIVAAAMISTLGCGKNSTGPGSTAPDYDPQIPASWASAVTNPFFKLTPGTSFEYEGQTEDGLETITVEVLSDTRVVNGVTATVVRDRVYLDDELIEDTYDWYAQDAAGNVWYLGEDSKEIENGMVVNTDGSWEWTIDDALPGIIMWADPTAHIGEDYRQEFYEGEAEDWGKVVAVNQSIAVPFGNFTGCAQIEEWNGLEAGPHDYKYYVPQIGVALEVPADGGGQRVELVDVTEP